MLVESTVRPTGIQVVDTENNALDEYLVVDTVKNGKIRILGQYNINEFSRVEFDKTITFYTYEEWALEWVPPKTYIVNSEIVEIDIMNRVSVEAYIAVNAFEIMGYIQQIKNSW
jgi:hypothetical protein